MFKFLSTVLVLSTFLMTSVIGPLPVAEADEFNLPVPGVMVHLSPPLEPPILKGIKVHADSPFRFDFILDRGDSYSSLVGQNSSVIASEARQSQQEQLKQEATRLIKYFLASLTIPEKDLWVNLSPYEKDRIIPNSFGLTEMGRDLLAEDYMLKQITASLIYPEDEVGKRFWKKVYEEATKKYGTTNIPVNTFNKVWIVPEKAVVYENAKAGTAYVVEAKLKVMLEQDYLAMSKHVNVGVTEGGLRPLSPTLTDRRSVGRALGPEGVSPVSAGFGEQLRVSGMRTEHAGETRGQDPNINSLGSQIIREIVIPELTKEVNEDKNFAKLRQVYNSLILATWYKKKIKDSILEQVYADKNKIAGVGYANSLPLAGRVRQGGDVGAIYQRYLQAFKKGVYNYIKEDVDPMTQETIPRKYFSGGETLIDVDSIMQNVSKLPSKAMIINYRAMVIQAEVNSAQLAQQEKDQAMVGEIPITNLIGEKEIVPGASTVDFKGKRMENLLKALDVALKKRSLAVSQPSNILLIGGSEWDVENLFKRFPKARITVVNLAQFYLERIQQKYNNSPESDQLQLFRANAQKLSDYQTPDGKPYFRDESFDLIAAPGVDETVFSNPLSWEFMGQIADQEVRLLSRGGFILHNYDRDDIQRSVSLQKEAMDAGILEFISDYMQTSPIQIVFRKNDRAMTTDMAMTKGKTGDNTQLANVKDLVMLEKVVAGLWEELSSKAGDSFKSKYSQQEILEWFEPYADAFLLRNDLTSFLKKSLWELNVSEPATPFALWDEERVSIEKGFDAIISQLNRTQEKIPITIVSFGIGIQKKDLIETAQIALEKLGAYKDRVEIQLVGIDKQGEILKEPINLNSITEDRNWQARIHYHAFFGDIRNKALWEHLASKIKPNVILFRYNWTANSVYQDEFIEAMTRYSPFGLVVARQNGSQWAKTSVFDNRIKMATAQRSSATMITNKVETRGSGQLAEDRSKAGKTDVAMLNGNHPNLVLRDEQQMDEFADKVRKSLGFTPLDIERYLKIGDRKYGFGVSKGQQIYRLGPLIFIPLWVNRNSTVLPAGSIRDLTTKYGSALGDIYHQNHKNILFIPPTSAVYHVPLSGHMAAVIAIMLDNVNQFKGATVIDQGAGSGVLSLVALSLGAKKVVLVENKDEEIAIARALLQAHGYQAKENFYIVKGDLNDVDKVTESLKHLNLPKGKTIGLVDIGPWPQYGDANWSALDILLNLGVDLLINAGYLSEDTQDYGKHRTEFRKSVEYLRNKFDVQELEFEKSRYDSFGASVLVAKSKDWVTLTPLELPPSLANQAMRVNVLDISKDVSYREAFDQNGILKYVLIITPQGTIKLERIKPKGDINVFKAYFNGRIISADKPKDSISFAINGNELFVSRLYLKEQGQGLGKLILDWIVSYAYRQGAKKYSNEETTNPDMLWMHYQLLQKDTVSMIAGIRPAKDFNFHNVSIMQSNFLGKIKNVNVLIPGIYDTDTWRQIFGVLGFDQTGQVESFQLKEGKEKFRVSETKGNKHEDDLNRDYELEGSEGHHFRIQVTDGLKIRFLDDEGRRYPTRLTLAYVKISGRLKVPPNMAMATNLGISMRQRNTNRGGIDLTSANMNLHTQSNGGAINFHLDPAQLQRLKDAPGFVPVIINIQPLNNIKQFLGIDPTT